MNFDWTLIQLPIVAATIGWFTNWVAIKMLFHPQKPINLGLFTLQGVFPKRHQAFAQKIGDLVGNQLFNMDDIKAKINTEDNRESVVKVIDEKIEFYLRNKLVAEMPMLAFIMSDSLVNKIKTTLMTEITEMLPEVMNTFTDNLSKNINVNQIVSSKVEAFSMDKLEEMLVSILEKEFKFIEIIGAVLGFLIGCIQLLLI
jgi:uncharacterized membrane protein YheB (UPF0754 family)